MNLARFQFIDRLRGHSPTYESGCLMYRLIEQAGEWRVMLPDTSFPFYRLRVFDLPLSEMTRTMGWITTTNVLTFSTPQEAHEFMSGHEHEIVEGHYS